MVYQQRPTNPSLGGTAGYSPTSQMMDNNIPFAFTVRLPDVRVHQMLLSCRSTMNSPSNSPQPRRAKDLLSRSPRRLTEPPPYVWAWTAAQSPVKLQRRSRNSVPVCIALRRSAATCKAIDDIDITLAEVTAGLLNEEAYICPDPANPDPNTRSVVLRPGEFASYDWFKDDVSLGINTPTLTADAPGLYSVLLENVFGCGSSDKTECAG